METAVAAYTEEKMKRALEALKSRFGYPDFRLDQRKVLQTLFAGRDLLAIMPTGGGKSLCYQIPAVLSDGLTVVISPLISLMKDQVDSMRLLGVSAAFLNSTLDAEGYSEVMANLRSGSTRLLYIAPERLFSQGMQFVDFLKTLSVELFAIDEAHCISQWGHDFRPEYLKLAVLKEHFPRVPVTAFTATADAATQKDIIQKLRLREPQTFVASFDRKNIHYRIEPKTKSFDQLVSFIQKRREESGIIYCLSRQSVETLCEKLTARGYSALPYHAGLNKETRDRNQELFLRDETKVMVATIAFGMGIHKSNVRYVAHMDMPKNIEGYYQETGRAGRDGLKSDALLFYSSADYARLAQFAQVQGNPQQTQILLAKLSRMSRFCELTTCRRKYLLDYFGESYEPPCGSCDNCTRTVVKTDETELAKTVIAAVQSLGRPYGVTVVADFLKGAASPKYAEVHRGLPGYGALQTLTKDAIRQRVRELVGIGVLKQEGLEYPVVRLAPKADEVLSGVERVELTVLETKKEKAVKEKSRPALEPLVEGEYDQELFEELRRVRKTLANAENVPAYIILSDKSLLDLTVKRPRTLEDLESVYGFGAVKIQKYGPTFLDSLAGR